MGRDLLVVPSLFKDATHTLYPLIDLSCFIPGFPALGHASQAILSESEPWWGTWVNRLGLL